MTLILSLFPGIGLLDKAFEMEMQGACVVRGPDVLWGGDVKAFHAPAGKFDGIIGGPPCQKFSKLQAIVALNRQKELKKDPTSTKYAEAENLIPEFVRVVQEACPKWWLMENVPCVPPEFWPRPSGYEVTSFTLNNRWVLDTTPQNRERRFWFGHVGVSINLVRYLHVAALEPLSFEYAVCAAGNGAPVPVRQNAGGKPKRLPKNIPNTRTVGDYNRLQGLAEGFLDRSPFTVAGKKRLIGNGVPLPMGRAIVKAIIAALKEADHANGA